MRRTRGSAISSLPIAPASPGAWVTTLRTPSGRPASAKISAQSSPPDHGDSSDGFSTTVLPRHIGATIARPDSTSAAFHGAMAATTPTGRRTAIAREPCRSDGMTWPTALYGAPAA